MPSSARDNYLTTQVRTAPPQKLQLMLIEAALRSAQRVQQHWQGHRDEAALNSLLHAEAILGQMLAAIDREQGGDLAQKVSSIYNFIFQRLVAAGQRHSEECLADAIRLLEIERETWRLLCEKLASLDVPPTGEPHVDVPHFLRSEQIDSLPWSGLSIEA
jgi:flagellar protein FliS